MSTSNIRDFERRIAEILTTSINEDLALGFKQIELLRQLHDNSFSSFEELHVERVRFGASDGQAEGPSRDETFISSTREQIIRLFEQRKNLIEVNRSIIMPDTAVGKKIMPTNPDQSPQPQKPDYVSRHRPWTEVVQSVVDAVAADLPIDAVDLDVAKSYPDRLERWRALGELAQRQREYENARERLDHAVETARSAGASWEDVGQVVGITAVSATRRWDPNARRRHSGYRQRSAPRDDEPGIRRDD